MPQTLLARQRAHQVATPTALAAQAVLAAGAVRDRPLAPVAGAFNRAAAEAIAAAREE